MTRSAARPARKPATRQDNRNRATIVFRDFVRQLEKLDARASDPKVGATFGINPMPFSLKTARGAAR